MRHPSNRNQRRLLKKIKDKEYVPTLDEKEVIDELRSESTEDQDTSD